MTIAPSSGSSDTGGNDFEVPRYQRKQTKRTQRRSQHKNTCTTQKTTTSDSIPVSTQGAGQSVAPSGSQVTMRESHVPQPRAAPITRDKRDTRAKEVSGNSQSQATVRAAPRTRNNQPTHDSEVQVFITGAHIKSSVRQIEEHIKVMGVRSCSVQDLSRQGNDATWKSFKAYLPASMKDTVLHRDNWPKGMRIRPFHPRRTNQPFRGNQHRNSRYSRPLQAANSSRNVRRHQRYDDSNQYREQYDTYHGEQHHNGRYYDQRDGSSYRWWNRWYCWQVYSSYAKGFKQSHVYISKLLSQCDTIGISETWLRPVELSSINMILMQSPDLCNVCNVMYDEINVYAKSSYMYV